jgi:hypothetical protein
MGPDVLSDSTSSEDIFLFLSSLSPFREVYCLAILFTVLDKSTKGVLDEKSFLLPRWLGILTQIREEILRILSYFTANGPGNLHFQICMWPGRDSTFIEPRACISPLMQNLSLDPLAFLENIIGNFSN